MTPQGFILSLMLFDIDINLLGKIIHWHKTNSKLIGDALLYVDIYPRQPTLDYWVPRAFRDLDGEE